MKDPRGFVADDTGSVQELLRDGMSRNDLPYVPALAQLY